MVISGFVRPEGIAFDADGNLWVADEGDNELLKFTPTQLETSGSPTTNITITSTQFEGPVGIAFKRDGGLWVASQMNSEVMLFTSSQLAAGGAQTPTVLLTSDGSGSLDHSFALTFDRKGNLWVSNLDDLDLDLGTVVAFSPSQLASSGSPTPLSP